MRCPVGKTLLGGDPPQRVGGGADAGLVARDDAAEPDMRQRVRQGDQVAERVGVGQGFGETLLGLRGPTPHDQAEAEIAEGRRLGIEGEALRQGRVLAVAVELDRTLQAVAGPEVIGQIETDDTDAAMGHQGGGVIAAGQRYGLHPLGDRQSIGEVGPDHTVDENAGQDAEHLLGFVELVGQRQGGVEGATGLRGRLAVRRDQGAAKGGVDEQLLAQCAFGLRQAGDQFQRPAQRRRGLGHGRAPGGELAGLEPPVDGRCAGRPR